MVGGAAAQSTWRAHHWPLLLGSAWLGSAQRSKGSPHARPGAGSFCQLRALQGSTSLPTSPRARPWETGFPDQRVRWPRVNGHWPQVCVHLGGQCGPRLLPTRRKDWEVGTGFRPALPQAGSRRGWGYGGQWVALIDWQQAKMPEQNVSKLAVIAGEIKSKQGELNEVFYKYYVF